MCSFIEEVFIQHFVFYIMRNRKRTIILVMKELTNQTYEDMGKTDNAFG